MGKRRDAKKGITVIEVVIAATLSCVILGVGMAMMRRSNIQFKKSNDLISAVSPFYEKIRNNKKIKL